MTRTIKRFPRKARVMVVSLALIIPDYFAVNAHTGMTALLFMLALCLMIVSAMIFLVFPKWWPGTAWMSACVFNLLMLLLLAISAMSWVVSDKMHTKGTIGCSIAIGAAVVYFLREKSRKQAHRPRHLEGV